MTGQSRTKARLAEALLDGEYHTASDLVLRTGVPTTSVYTALQRMYIDGWVERESWAQPQRYRITRAGKRGLAFLLALQESEQPA